MAKLRSTKGNDKPAYIRIFGNFALARLLSQVQGTASRNGSELPSIIAEHVEGNYVARVITYKQFLKDPAANPQQYEWLLVVKPKAQRSEEHQAISSNLLLVNTIQRKCIVVQLRDGDPGGVMTQEGTVTRLRSNATAVANETAFATDFALCSFNAPSVDALRSRLAGLFKPHQLLTGEQLCAMLGVGYAAVVAERERDQSDNIAYFIQRLTQLDIMQGDWQHS